jgi:hypothetical protein
MSNHTLDSIRCEVHEDCVSSKNNLPYVYNDKSINERLNERK